MPRDPRPTMSRISANCQESNLNSKANMEIDNPKYFNLFKALSVINLIIKKIAERKGFEPSIRFWRIHTFQACAFDHSATSLVLNHKVQGLKYRKKIMEVKT
jgi:hypothetical protein